MPSFQIYSNPPFTLLTIFYVYMVGTFYVCINRRTILFQVSKNMTHDNVTCIRNFTLIKRKKIVFE